MEVIKQINKDVDPRIYKIMNESYNEFIEKYGDKHSKHIKETLKSISNKIKVSETYFGSISGSACIDGGIVYTKGINDLETVLKHELWHTYNRSINDFNDKHSIDYLSDRYKKVLINNGYIKNEYNKEIERKKIQRKDGRYEIENYDKFLAEFLIGNDETEKWTEWFNVKTHTKDIKYGFVDLENGYFMKNLSSGSFYDNYTNMADMVSCLIPKEKLLEMYLNSRDYKTGYSHEDMMKEFDDMYENALDENEKNYYKYPYLKLLLDTNCISENARTNKEKTLETLQSSMKTCFKAYNIKLENYKNFDIKDVKTVFEEIKYMQEHMVWNLDINKMKDLDYIKEMEKIQNKFKSMCKKLDRKNPEIKEMIKKVDYKTYNSLEKVKDGDEIIKNVFLQSEEKNNLKRLGTYVANTNENGIKGNLYSTLNLLYKNHKFNLIFKNYQKEYFENGENKLVEIYNMIKDVKSENDIQKIVNIYNYMYNDYKMKLEKLQTNTNISGYLHKYHKDIINIQKNTIINIQDKNYLPSFEKIKQTYEEKINEFKKYIDYCSKKKIEKRIKNNINIEIAKKYEYRNANKEKKNYDKFLEDMNEEKKSFIEKCENKNLIENKEENKMDYLLVENKNGDIEKQALRQLKKEKNDKDKDEVIER